MQKITLYSLLAGSTLLGACSVHHDHFKASGETVSISVSSTSIRSDSAGTSLDLSNIRVTPRKGKKPCDVKIWVQKDLNGDGQIDDDERWLVYGRPGVFQGFQKGRTRMHVKQDIDSAALVVESRDGNNKNAKPERHMFGIDRSGIHRLSRENPAAFFYAGGISREHFVDVLPNPDGSFRIGIGDLAARTSVHAGLARHGLPDFAAAAILIDNSIVAILAGNDQTYAKVPKIQGKLGRVRVITFDRRWTVCGDFELSNLRT